LKESCTRDGGQMRLTSCAPDADLAPRCRVAAMDLYRQLRPGFAASAAGSSRIGYAEFVGRVAEFGKESAGRQRPRSESAPLPWLSEQQMERVASDIDIGKRKCQGPAGGARLTDWRACVERLFRAADRIANVQTTCGIAQRRFSDPRHLRLSFPLALPDPTRQRHAVRPGQRRVWPRTSARRLASRRRLRAARSGVNG